MPQMQGPRPANSNENRPSVMDTDDAHVPDCLVWRDRWKQDNGLPVPPGRVRRWYCQNYNRCDEGFFRQSFCRQYHAKNNTDQLRPSKGGKHCQRWHCQEEPCQNNKCVYNHCRDPECHRQRFESSGCPEPNCRKCRGLDPKINRQLGYVRRPELGRPKDRGIHSEPPTYRPRPNDGSAAEAVAGWPEIKMKRNGLLEPLATGRLAKEDGNTADLDVGRQARDDSHVRRHQAQAGVREDPRELWKMPRFTNGAKPRISSFRDPNDPALPNHGRPGGPQPIDERTRDASGFNASQQGMALQPAPVYRDTGDQQPQIPRNGYPDEGYTPKHQQYGNAEFNAGFGQQQQQSYRPSHVNGNGYAGEAGPSGYNDSGERQVHFDYTYRNPHEDTNNMYSSNAF